MKKTNKTLLIVDGETKRSVRKMSTLTLVTLPHGKGNYQNRVWEDNIPGYPGYYISPNGKVYSRWDVNGKGVLTKRFHKKEPHLNKKGRMIVGLSQLGIGTTKWLVSRLVAIVYIPNPLGLPYVCHKNNNPLINRYTNLYWGTQKMNMGQASKDGRLNPLKGSNHPSFKSTDLQRSYIPKMKMLGLSKFEIAEILGVGPQLVKDYLSKYNKIYGTLQKQ